MKKILLLVFINFLYLNTIDGQTTLSEGDIGIIYYSDNLTAGQEDEFALVAYVDLSVNTLIYVTDQFVNANNTFQNNAGSEGHLLYTVNTAITAGTIIEYNNATGVSGNGTWSAHAGLLSLSTGGDQLCIYQDTDGVGGTAPENNPTLIFMLNAASNNKTPSGCSTTSGLRTHAPSDLDAVAAGVGDGAGTYLALGIGAACNDENDHLYYNGTFGFANAAAAKAAINDPDNWTGSAALTPLASYTSGVTAIKAESSVIASGAPEIAITDPSGDAIADGAALGATSATNSTDFGDACVTGGTASFTYTITNSGDADLDFTGSPLVTLTGGNSGDFSVTSQIATDPLPHTTGNTTTFTIQFDPTATGQRTTTVSIANDDSDENPYDFVIEGNGINATITVAATTSTVSEAGGTALEFTFTRDCTSGQLDVNFSIEGTAEDADYTVGGTGLVPSSYNTTNNTGDVRFADTSATAVITVTPADDSLIEASETVVVKVDNP